ncbi:MAG: hypothetical protein JEY91_18660 [Spirochaetaceae bacterium]|nr:hypothetical protein [Spirochaetaceae bacterium]
MNGTVKIVGYNGNMRKYLLPLLTVFLCSCILNGSGIRTLSGTLSGGLLTANVKVGVFAPDVTFIYDNLTPGEPDSIYHDQNLNTTGTFTPIVLATMDSSDSYRITFPEDPATVNCLIAWDDANGNDIYDMDTNPGPGEIAYLPVKTINGIDSVVTHFTSIEVAQEITYIVNYADLSLYTTIDRFPSEFTDNLDVTGAEGFNFIFD